MKVCKLFHFKETIYVFPERAAKVKFARDLCHEPLRKFDDILDSELQPFSDELSLRFMKETYDIKFVDNMHFREQGCNDTYAIHNLSKAMKETLMLLRNSRLGIYTEVKHTDCRIADWIQSFEDFDLLFAYIVDSGECEDTPVVEWFYPLKIENFKFKGQIIPLILDYKSNSEGRELVNKTGKWFHLYRYPDGTYDSVNFFALFRYDWKMELPDIKDYIDDKYMYYKNLDTYEKICELNDILPTDYAGWDDELRTILPIDYAEAYPSNPKVVSHLLYLPRIQADSRRIVMIFVDYLENGSISLIKDVSFKYPNLRELLEEHHEVEENIKKRFFLYVDVDEVIRSKEDFEKTWIGGYIYKDYLELYNKDDALREFAKIIPDILEKQSIDKWWLKF